MAFPALARRAPSAAGALALACLAVVLLLTSFSSARQPGALVEFPVVAISTLRRTNASVAGVQIAGGASLSLASASTSASGTQRATESTSVSSMQRDTSLASASGTQRATASTSSSGTQPAPTSMSASGTQRDTSLASASGSQRATASSASVSALVPSSSPAVFQSAPSAARKPMANFEFPITPFNVTPIGDDLPNTLDLAPAIVDAFLQSECLVFVGPYHRADSLSALRASVLTIDGKRALPFNRSRDEGSETWDQTVYIGMACDESLRGITDATIHLEYPYLNGTVAHRDIRVGRPRTAAGCSFAMMSILSPGQLLLLPAWVDYYVTLGVCHFYVYYQGTLDALERNRRWPAVAPTMESGRVSLIPWPMRLRTRETLPGVTYGTHISQITAQQSAFIRFGPSHDAMLFFDPDEYLTVGANSSIKSILDAYPSYEAMRFGSVWTSVQPAPIVPLDLVLSSLWIWDEPPRQLRLDNETLFFRAKQLVRTKRHPLMAKYIGVHVSSLSYVDMPATPAFFYHLVNVGQTRSERLAFTTRGRNETVAALRLPGAPGIPLRPRLVTTSYPW